jgi:transcriptional regulator with XRE-family HTH domain
MRRDLGRQLAGRRRAAGLVQRELGVMSGYSRTAVASAETGTAGIAREFWARMDGALETGEVFTRGHDRIQAHLTAQSQARMDGQVPAAEPAEVEQEPAGVTSPAVGEALRAYGARGWPAERDGDGCLWLRTGTAIDALEVSRTAGLVAMGWWLYTRGVPDQIRGIPALPDPADALAVIAAGSRCLFLVRSGACPWTRRDTGAAGPAGAPPRAAVRWHADGGRVLAPPSRLEGGERAEWAHVPDGEGRLASPMALLHVLAAATAATSQGVGLVLPGGICAVPVPSAEGGPE